MVSVMSEMRGSSSYYQDDQEKIPSCYNDCISILSKNDTISTK